MGLSPRLRGNPRIWPPAGEPAAITARWRSIPAPAGDHQALRVYPRACGGTTDTGQVVPWGLSPRLRGNPGTGVPGSIPAPAGEPCQRSRHGRSIPAPAGEPFSLASGLSPRLRGSLARVGPSSRLSVYPRACGGTHMPLLLAAQRVYPRACGGTPANQICRGPARQT